MTNIPFLSVILPTYNRKYYISRMIDSVLMQSFKDFELIIIDDGSTDGTKEMLEAKYRDGRIRIVCQDNGGVSSARNLGISLAKGKYITFVDSDDYLLDGFFEDIYENLKEYQHEVLVYGGYNLKHHHQIEVPLFWLKKEYKQFGVVLNCSRTFIKDFCLFGGNSWGCAKVFKTTLIQKKGILFDSQITYGEDLLFNVRVYFASSNILTSSRKFYMCDNNTKSLSRGMISSKQKIENLLLVYKKLQLHEDYTTYFALSFVRSIRRWILITYVFLDKQTKKQIQTMYGQALQHDSCNEIEKIELKLAKRSPLCALPVSCFLFIAYKLYSKLSFIHPITSPIVKCLKNSSKKNRKV